MIPTPATLAEQIAALPPRAQRLVEIEVRLYACLDNCGRSAYHPRMAAPAPDYTSLPDAQRPRPKACWTIHRSVIAATEQLSVDLAAASPAEVVEVVLAVLGGIPVPPPPARGRARSEGLEERVRGLLRARAKEK